MPHRWISVSSQIFLVTMALLVKPVQAVSFTNQGSAALYVVFISTLDANENLPHRQLRIPGHSSVSIPSTTINTQKTDAVDFLFFYGERIETRKLRGAGNLKNCKITAEKHVCSFFDPCTGTLPDIHFESCNSSAGAPIIE